MDTFRWSDGYSCAVEFRGEETSFIEPAMTALKTFHAKTANKYHDGKTKTNMVHLRQAELHIQVFGIWRPLKHDGALVVFPVTVEDTPESIVGIYEKIETELLFKQQMIWRRVDAAYINGRNMIQFISRTMDILDEAISEEQHESDDDSD
jgi:hypothetical protein